MASDLIRESRGTVGFLSPMGDHVIGTRADMKAFFDCLAKSGADVPVMRGHLYQGYVGLDEVDALERDVAVGRRVLGSQRATRDGLQQAGFTADYLAKNTGSTLSDICAKPLAVLDRVIEELRAEAEYFPDNPNMAIRTSSTAIPDSMLIRDLPRDAFFRDGEPLWLRSDLPGSAANLT